jgi:C-terminal processing protease CtpA/Prc
VTRALRPPALALLVSLAACSRAPSTSPLPASSAPAPDDENLQPGEAQRILDAIPPLFKAHYLDPDVASAMIAALRDPARREAWTRIPTRRAFARTVTDDLRAISHDRHVTLHYEDAQAKAGPSKEELAHDKQLEASAGFVSIERRAGNVAYLRLDSFGPYADGVKGEDVYAQQLTKVADADALILDLRENHGGYPEMVALLVSYLVDATPVHLVDFWDHDDNSTSQSWTKATVGGTRFGGHKPIFVLVSKETFSGGEEAAYDLQAMKRATIVGETTGGGANFSPRHKLDEHFTLAVPQGRALSAITGKNWEGVGVTPDVVVSPDQAPQEALARATAAAKR